MPRRNLGYRLIDRCLPQLFRCRVGRGPLEKFPFAALTFGTRLCVGARALLVRGPGPIAAATSALLTIAAEIQAELIVQIPVAIAFGPVIVAAELSIVIAKARRPLLFRLPITEPPRSVAIALVRLISFGGSLQPRFVSFAVTEPSQSVAMALVRIVTGASVPLRRVRLGIAMARRSIGILLAYALVVVGTLPARLVHLTLATARRRFGLAARFLIAKFLSG
ncbi:MAG: hypothetical protein WB677_01885 [Xanthobacteraceae bacterium]